MVWIEFLICSALLTFAAYNLCKEGIVISEKTRLEEGIIGMFFLAVATSFPEIVTGSVAIHSLDKIGLGYGDIVGSVIVNLMILAGLDFALGKGRLLLRVSGINKITGVFVLLVGIVVSVSIWLRLAGVPVPAIKGVGIENILIIALYILCLKYVKNHNGQKHVPARDIAKDETVTRAWIKFGFLLVAVMVLGTWMAFVGERLVKTSGMSETFVGTLLLGFATSLPEIIVSFTALRAASADMAVGNILGSNLFDICIISFLDGLTRRPILGMLSPGQVVATVVMLVLSGFAVWGMFIKKDRPSRVSWDTGLIFIVGFAGFVLLYIIS